MAKEKDVETDTPLHVVVAQTNSEESTYDGIDWGGERVAQEIMDEIESLAKEGKKVTKFSITGYSLGGLVSRYVVGILFQKGFFKEVTPVNFNTIATPHLGLPRYPSFFSMLSNALGPRLLSRTGEQFYCVDKWSSTGKPLLEIMADPERIFYQALASFQQIRIYANAVYDTTVPFVTAAMEVEDPFADHDTNGIEIEYEEDYPRVIKSYSLPPVPPAPTPKPIVLSKNWFEQRKTKNSKPKRPILPPFLRFRFPLNIVFYALVPFLIPTVATLVVVRFMKESKKSKARIKALEKDIRSEQSLAQVLAKLEHDMEAAVEGLIEEPQRPTTAKQVDEGDQVPELEKPAVLSPLQRRMAQQLNTLPIEKHFAFLDAVFNSHGSIIMRDVKRFPFQIIGEGVVKHWTDSLIV
ncbi:hypothetical protein V5O48_004699 [Marasmius crinis-equi]|uniref:DUF676 domain-containing protein n=1 Tax=Marasmius crinis-equi TaxID=585013 RepID=A0ABR3FPI0_9AGAR